MEPESLWFWSEDTWELGGANTPPLNLSLITKGVSLEEEYKHPEKQALLLEMDVSMTTKFVFVAMCLRADWKDLTCFPSQSDIASVCGISKIDTVSKHQKILIDKGWILHLGQRQVGKWKHNVYKIIKGIEPVKNKKKKPKIPPEMAHLKFHERQKLKGEESKW